MHLRNPSRLSNSPQPAVCNLDAAGKLTCDDISEGGTPNVQPPRRFFQKHGVTDLALNFKLSNRASEEGQPLAKFLKYFKLFVFTQNYITLEAKTNISNILVGGERSGGGWTH